MAKRLWPGCVNAAGKLRQKWKATAETKFSKPGQSLLVEPVQRLAKVNVPGCVNAAGKLRQKW